ncbi:MAG: HEAT repeat domain-containing protein, partial [Acidobacteriota bacterium]|nr:HEAT repeat domain-containing protein [Acidobacteriota bacterium]
LPGHERNGTNIFGSSEGKSVMMCGQAKELIAASWMGDLDTAEARKLRQHLEACAECSTEMSQLGAMWERLADIPAPEPSPLLDERWQLTLEALITQRKGKSWRFSLAGLSPGRPIWQMAAAVILLAGGIAIGWLLPHGDADRGEVAKLREEVASTKEMVTLSLLQQQSATERLRGVDYSVRMPMLDPQVVSALVQAVKNDASVNVRLAAIDALAKVSGDARVRQSLTQSLTQQDSPMVQAALIDYAVDARDRGAMGPLAELAGRPDLNPAIRQRAESAVKRLTEYR